MAENNLSFEQAYKQLEVICEKLSSSEITLDETVKLYEEGIKLAKICADMIDAAKQKIETLRGESI
ncbi:MAG: exodeoxyribonuclease VII small subunit [Clostridia bacterium]|nr:exodeoxyribonuclease VII small subunit [Clostridia bacterium]